MTRHVTAEYFDAFRTMCHQSSDKKRIHGELGKSRKLKDKSDVAKVVDVLDQNQNPFDLETVPPMLINIITGQVDSVEVSLINIYCCNYSKYKTILRTFAKDC